MSEFYEKKGIKKEFSVARTPQQNGVAERRNMTLIEAARTMPKAVVSDKKGNEANVLKASACWVWRPKKKVLDYVSRHNGASMNFKRFDYGNPHLELQKKGVIDNGCSRHMTGNKSYLSDYEEINGGFVAFGGDPKGGRITGKEEEEKKGAEHLENEDCEVPNIEEPRVNQEQDANVNSTNNINTVSPTVNVVDIENNDVMRIYPTPTTRIHKDHTLEQIIRDIHSAPQTRRITKSVTDHVWTLMDLPHGKRAIGTKWVYMNKKDKRGIVIRNKARLVAQGYTQEERIYYDEVFALVARIEAIRLFLVYTSFKDIVMYQIEVNSAFLYGKIEEEVYACQPLGFEDPEFPDKVYKVEKALYGLHQAPKAWYETLSTYLLDNGFQRGQIDKTLFIKRVKGDILLVQVYVDDIIFGSTKKELCTKSMIGSLMYLTALRPDIMFYVCACARFQVTAKGLHLHAVKRIFRYLKGQPKLGLWCLKDSPFDLDLILIFLKMGLCWCKFRQEIHNRRLSISWEEIDLMAM
ncbi:putative ribonuclease H-like domain-containing protein [Tanacetum coccineum]